MSTLLTRGAVRQASVAVRALLALTLVTVLYTLLVTAVGQVLLPAQANGSLIRADGRVVGSALIGQSFTSSTGAVLPRWFQSRPSAAGAGYDASASGASNLGPENPALVTAIRDRRAALAAAFRVPKAALPPDALTASASGLDPHISPAYARLQVASVARARHLPAATVARLVDRAARGPDLGYLGAPTVNVLALNAALAKMDPAGDG